MDGAFTSVAGRPWSAPRSQIVRCANPFGASQRRSHGQHWHGRVRIRPLTCMSRTPVIIEAAVNAPSIVPNHLHAPPANRLLQSMELQAARKREHKCCWLADVPAVDGRAGGQGGPWAQAQHRRTSSRSRQQHTCARRQQRSCRSRQQHTCARRGSRLEGWGLTAARRSTVLRRVCKPGCCQCTEHHWNSCIGSGYITRAGNGPERNWKTKSATCSQRRQRVKTGCYQPMAWQQ